MSAGAQKLEPCPFCGSDNVRVWSTTHELHGGLCDDCGAHAPWSLTKADAIAAWNRRVISGSDVTVVQHINIDTRADQASILAAIRHARDAATTELRANLGRTPAAQPVPQGAVWTRHGSGDSEWWSYGAWKAHKHGGTWVLTANGKEVARDEYLQNVMARATDAAQAERAHPQDALHYLQMGLENLALGNGVHTVDFRNLERVLQRMLTHQSGEAGADAPWIPLTPDTLPQADTDVFVRGRDRCNALRHDVAGMFNGEWMSQATQNNCDFTVNEWMPIPRAAMAAQENGNG